VRVRTYNKGSQQLAEWKFIRRGEAELILRWPHKLSDYHGGMRTSYSALRDEEGKARTFKSGTIGYVVQDTSPTRRKKSVLIRVRLRGFDGYAHVDNFEPYDHDEEDKDDD
jgi:hypothetical protein